MRIVLVCGGVPLRSGKALGADTQARLKAAHSIGSREPFTSFLVGSVCCPALPNAEQTQGQMMARCLRSKSLRVSVFTMQTFDTYGEVQGLAVELKKNPRAEAVVVCAPGHTALVAFLIAQLAPEYKKPVTFVCSNEIWSRTEQLKEKLRYAKARLPRRVQVVLVKVYRTVFGYF